MDGNGALGPQKRHLPRVAGHRAGDASAAERRLRLARGLKVEALTLYAFSVEELAGGRRRRIEFFDVSCCGNIFCGKKRCR